jgi:hypothetical protein
MPFLGPSHPFPAAYQIDEQIQYCFTLKRIS